MCTGEYRLQFLSVVCGNTKIRICKTVSAVCDCHGFTPVSLPQTSLTKVPPHPPPAGLGMESEGQKVENSCVEMKEV